MANKQNPACIEIHWQLWLEDLRKSGVYIPFPLEQYLDNPKCKRLLYAKTT